MIGREIISEIDVTIDQLIQNAKTMNEASTQELTKEEIDAFQKTQESLLAHLIHIDGKYKMRNEELKNLNKDSASYKIQQKLRKFEKLNKEFVQNVSEKLNVIHFAPKKRKNQSKRTKRKGFSRVKNQ